MKEYVVSITAGFYKDYTIEADSEDDAIVFAISDFENEYSDDWDSLDAKVED